MVLLDVNVLVYAFREDCQDHKKYRDWLEDALNGGRVAVSELVLSGVLRIDTHPKIFRPPTPLAQALGFVEALLSHSSVFRIRAGEHHWDIFLELCRVTGVEGNSLPDAYHAALAMEHGLEWVTTDVGFRRFPGLRWRHPFALPNS